MKISYAITVCNERDELERLVEFLLQHKREQDEIVILVDEANSSGEVRDYVEMIAQECQDQHVTRSYHPLRNNFAAHKNHLNSLCSGDYIFQIDADETPHASLIENLPAVLEHNSAVELYAVPRVNTVEGLTQEHIQKWRWNIDQQGWVNWPDFQTRIYKRSPEIRWKNKVHEVIEGHGQFAYLPMEEQWALYHPKTIDRQEAAVKLYQTIDTNVREKL